MSTQPARLFPGIATLLGYQDDGNGGGFWLYNLTMPIPGHPVGSTVSEITLLTSRQTASRCPSLPRHGQTGGQTDKGRSERVAGKGTAKSDPLPPASCARTATIPISEMSPIFAFVDFAPI